MVTAINRMRRGETVKIHFAESLISSLDINESDLDPNFRAFQELVQSLGTSVGQPRVTDSKGYDKVDGSNRIWGGVPWEEIEPLFSDYNASINACLDRTTAAGRSLLHNYIESVRAHGDLATWTVVIIGSSRGSRAVTGLDEDFRTVNRNRLMNESRCEEPYHRGRVSFKGVALGGDEGMDLTRDQKDEVDELIEQNKNLSRAMLYRSMRPSTHGLLLIYPIIPTTPKAAKERGIEDAAFLWGQKDPVIGIGVSLPGSLYDSGCDYVCTRQKLREMFGVLSEDMERDEEEDREDGASG
jgi:hypothetical protein